MALILTRTNERARYVWSRDPAVESEYTQVDPDADLILSVMNPESEAKLVAGEVPTYFTLRPLNSSEVFSYFFDDEKTQELATRLEVACAVCVEISQVNLPPLVGDSIRKTLMDLGDVALINALFEQAKEASLRGVGRDPFRLRSGDSESGQDNGDPVRA
jgi:hypothetical protein